MASNEQVGGDHYKSAYQHWRFVEDVGMGYLEGYASKYLVRWRKKGGVQDLEKARSAIEELRVQHARPNGRKNRSYLDGYSFQHLEAFLKANPIPKLEFRIIVLLTRWWVDRDLEECVKIIDQLITTEQNKETF